MGTMTKEESYEKLGILIDDIESLSFGLQLNMSAEFHVEQLKSILPDKVKQLKEVFIEITGENPWD
jgi:hypothetical protein